MNSSYLRLNPELIASEKYAYTPAGIKITNFEQELESQEYAALRFKINNLNILFRVAKTTPTKTGQFVTIWKRLNNGPIMPFDSSDPIDLVIIGVNQNKGTRRGQFIFPKKILLEKKIFSLNNKGGKRAIRVYAPWDKAENVQAQATQRWQLLYFFEFGPDIKLDTQKINLLVNKN